MKRVCKILLILLVLSFMMGNFYSAAWAEEKIDIKDPSTHELSMVDLLIVRPIGVVAGITGTALFVVTLPFTIPSGGVKDAANIFITQPFQFAFTRDFPDEGGN